ncbi:MAG: WXG100 family type VII secretion target [Lachnospiraceae bacterium]
MARINVRPSQIEHSASRLENIADNLQAEINQLNLAKNVAESAWKSQSTSTYVSAVDVVEENISKISGQINQMAYVLKKLAADIRRVEKENSGRM